mgnify:CR=1 FL=1
MQRQQPLRATTNPSLILKAAQMEEYGELVNKVTSEAANMDEALDKLAALQKLRLLSHESGVHKLYRNAP